MTQELPIGHQLTGSLTASMKTGEFACTKSYYWAKGSVLELLKANGIEPMPRASMGVYRREFDGMDAFEIIPMDRLKPMIGMHGIRKLDDAWDAHAHGGTEASIKL